MTPVPNDNELHRIAVTGIIWRKETDGKRRYLIIKRAPHKKVWPGKWAVPGGGLEVKDYMDGPPTRMEGDAPIWSGALETALRREIREEVGLEVQAPTHLLDNAFIRPDGIPVMVIVFYCEYASGDVALDADATEYAWITAHDIAKYDFLQGIDEEILRVEGMLSKKPGG